MLDSSDNDWLRGQASQRLAQLNAMDQIDQLSAIVDRYQKLANRLPESWFALVRAGVLRGTPLDPSGTPYELDPTSGVVSLSPSSPLHPLPTEPPGAAPQ
jgi:hypothetical protein